MSDEGFQEIHLGNKQLVFLAMTGVVVLVAAFLFGVFVGRGGASPGGGVATTQAQTGVEGEPAEIISDPVPVAAPPSAAPLAAPDPIDEDLSYQRRLEGETPAGESIAPEPQAAAPASEPRTAVDPPAPAKAVPAPAATPAGGALTEPAGPGFAVQIVALRDRPKAEAVARRLASKGHRAYVAPGGRDGRMHRVLVGKFKTRQEAEQVKRRIEKEEQFKPWIIP
ncbi:MAG TPA: SPOR domain-containing protein [Vicinamibacterales bacterium]|nr:SPOR domain-containing protein [Vicinamibacterales bacterium]